MALKPSSDFAQLNKLLLEERNAGEQRLRSDIGRLLDGHRYLLRAAAGHVYDKPGWYEMRATTDLDSAGYPVPPLELAFPVDPACPWWHDAEQDPRDDAVFRFFVDKAWIDLPEPPHACAEIRLPIHFHLTPEALHRLKVKLDGSDACELGRHIDEVGRTVIRYTMARPQAVRMELECTISGVVAEIFVGATDGRRLSVAVGCPRWHTSEQS